MPDGSLAALPRAQAHYECRRFETLGARDLDDWRRLCEGDRDLASPLLGPGFAALVAGQRDDVRIILARRDERLIGVLGVHKRPFGHARPIGAPFNDYCGPVVAPGEDVCLPAMLAAGGQSSYHAPSAVIAPERLGKVSLEGEDQAYVIQLDGRTPEAYIEEFRSQHAKRHKNFRRLLRQLERSDEGELKLVWGPPDRAQLARLLDWKSAQFRRDGLVDVTSATHSAQVLQAAARLRADDDNELHGFMISLMLGDTLLAGHFGVREGRHFHPWIAAFNPEYSEHAPGILLIYKAVSVMDQIGLETYDLSGGHDHYKKYFAAPLRRTLNIRASSGDALGAVGALQRAGWRAIGGSAGEGAGARLRRRLDHIGACEPGFSARIGEFVTALRKRS